uniref:Probable pectate lyase F n=1 Tax=Globisporangium ultimum (strain ATCC 200006 / CBS 805.95 / DAOM BR144) TaxID=431595 RepID=K3X5F6_GLOUD
MVKIFAATASIAAAFLASASAASMPTGTWPTSTGTVKYSEPYTVKAGTTFDGGLKTYERSNVQCNGDTEGDTDGAVFLVEAGATLKNVIIGAAQSEGVHCEDSGCTIENVWWSDVCEDALSIKGGSASSVSKVIGGGARYADDKVVQHNGYGTVTIDGFYVQDFGKLYRSCGSCKTQVQRKVSVSNVYAVNPGVSLVTVNKNYNDEATLSNIKIKTSDQDGFTVCAWSKAVTSGEPTELGDGPSSPLCQYSTSDITYTS